MHRRMSRKTFKSLTCIDKCPDFRITFIKCLKFIIGFKRFVNRHSDVIWYHFRYRVCFGIWDIHNPSNIFYYTFCGKCTECNYLYHSVLAIFAHYVINHFRASLIAEIDVNIRHRYTFRIKKTFKKQIISYRIDIRYFQNGLKGDPSKLPSLVPGRRQFRFS